MPSCNRCIHRMNKLISFYEQYEDKEKMIQTLQKICELTGKKEKCKEVVASNIDKIITFIQSNNAGQICAKIGACNVARG